MSLTASTMQSAPKTIASPNQLDDERKNLEHLSDGLKDALCRDGTHFLRRVENDVSKIKSGE